MRIRNRIQSFDDRNCKILQVEEKSQFFGSKLAVYFLSLGPHEGRLSFRRSLEPLKREHPALQNMKFLHFFLFFALLDPDPDPADQNQSGTMRIRIHNTAFKYPVPGGICDPCAQT
jgi:hypothetical protein